MDKVKLNSNLLIFDRKKIKDIDITIEEEEEIDLEVEIIEIKEDLDQDQGQIVKDKKIIINIKKDKNIIKIIKSQVGTKKEKNLTLHHQHQNPQV